MGFEILKNQEVESGRLKNFPNRVRKNLPAILLVFMGLAVSLCLILLGGRHLSTLSVQANSQIDPAIAPAGTVLRVRLADTIDTVHGRPGDQFRGFLDSPVAAAGQEVLRKGTVVVGHLVSVRDARRQQGRSVLALALDFYERKGRLTSLSTSTVARTTLPAGLQREDIRTGVSVDQAALCLPADTIVGFTLKKAITE
jgi:hypothetical protein